MTGTRTPKFLKDTPIQTRVINAKELARLVTYEKIEGTNDYKMEEVPISTIQIGDMIEVRALVAAVVLT